jgi:hypothetical protein
MMFSQLQSLFCHKNVFVEGKNLYSVTGIIIHIQNYTYLYSLECAFQLWNMILKLQIYHTNVNCLFLSYLWFHMSVLIKLSVNKLAYR